jgi:hypothetical protein
MTISPVSQLTYLTRLEFSSFRQPIGETFAAVPTTSRLQSLSICSTSFHGISDPGQSWLLQRLLSGCPSLTHLALPYASISQQGLDTLLKYGTKIKRLEASRIQAVQDRSSAACSWRRLKLGAAQEADVAYLPLHTLQQLEVPAVSFSTDQSRAVTPALMHKAACNLAACPAFQQQRWGGKVTLDMTKQDRWPLAELLAALAPLRALQPKQFSMSVGNIRGAPLEAGEVQAMADSLGSNIQKLEINSARLGTSFLTALLQHLPHLTALVLYDRVDAQPVDICLYCKALPAAPFHLTLHGYQLQGPQLKASFSAFGVTHVNVKP